MGRSSRSVPALPLRVLLVDGDPDDARLVREALAADGDASSFRVIWVSEISQAELELRRERYEAVLLDPNLAEGHGLQRVSRLVAASGESPVVLLTADDDDHAALEGARLGAQDCLTKGGAEMGTLARRLRQAVERNRLLVDERRSRALETYLASRDPLTALPNRKIFMDHLAQSMALARRHGNVLAALFIDLDGFKLVNDSMGHPAGDLLLARAGERMRGALRESDGLCRYGGHEFAACLSQVADARGAARAARNVLNALYAPEIIEGTAVRLGASIGVALFPGSARTPERLLRQADQAMHRVKQRGGGGIEFYAPPVPSEGSGQHILESHLRLALERDEIHTWFQPQVDTTEGRIVAAEALVRWQHPTRGLLQPSEFLALAMESGLMPALADQVLQAACRTAVRCRGREPGHALRVAVNLAPSELEDPFFGRRVTAVLEQTRAAPDEIEFEISEQGLFLRGDAALKSLRWLKECGARLAIGGFGTGGSSLATMNVVPADTLKIDRSLVMQAGVDSRATVMLAGIVGLGRRMQVDVVAEGVESIQQMKVLSSYDCRRMQGFCLGRPEPAEVFERTYLISRLAGSLQGGCRPGSLR